jgi:hypothetical protein
MKSLFTLVVLLLPFQKEATAVSEEPHPIDIYITVTKEYFSNNPKGYYKQIYPYTELTIPGDSAQEKRYDINLIIKNNSTKDVYIPLMTCSWSDGFIVNNNYIFISGKNCDHNFETIIKFKPGQSRTYRTTLLKSIKFDYAPENTIYGPQVETTKLGLIIISDIFKEDAFKTLDYSAAMQDKSKWQIVWSNPLYLLGKQPAPKVFHLDKK